VREGIIKHHYYSYFAMFQAQ